MDDVDSVIGCDLEHMLADRYWADLKSGRSVRLGDDRLLEHMWKHLNEPMPVYHL